jgi:hypothetical protein
MPKILWFVLENPSSPVELSFRLLKAINNLAVALLSQGKLKEVGTNPSMQGCF